MYIDLTNESSIFFGKKRFLKTHFQTKERCKTIWTVYHMFIKMFLETSFYFLNVTYSEDLITDKTNGDILKKDHILHT